MSWSAPPTGTSEEALVAQIKELQRSDPHAKEQWVAYAKMAGQGKMDPAKHGADFLGAFLAQLQSGIPVPQGGAENDSCLGEAIKLMQKKSPAFKGIWEQFCVQFGGGRMDPTRHDGTYHMKFFDSLAQTATGGTMGPMLQGGGNAPMKRMRDGSGAGLGTTMGGGSEKEQFVAQVKAFQRAGPEQKELWGVYADTYLQGILDPSRHDAATLKEFCDNHGVPPAPAAGGGGWMGGGMAQISLPGFGGRPGGAMDPEKEVLVERIQLFQKAAREHAEAWSSFAGPTKDPKRHEVATLREFCDTHGVPASPAAGGGGWMGAMGGAMGGGVMGGAMGGGIGGGGMGPISLAGFGGGGLGGAFDPEKDALVQRIQAWQKAARENAETWASFAGSTKDPKRHEVAKLQEFCERYIPA